MIFFLNREIIYAHFIALRYNVQNDTLHNVVVVVVNQINYYGRPTNGIYINDGVA